jgi:hypothetical protein
MNLFVSGCSSRPPAAPSICSFLLVAPSHWCDVVRCNPQSGYYGTYCQYRGRSAAAGVAPSWIAVAAATVLVALQLIKF